VISWSPSSDNVGVVQYGIYQGLQRVGTSTEPTTTLNGLSCGTSYAYGVDAADSAGNRSLIGNVFVRTASCPTPTPPPPSGDTTAPTQPTGLASSNVTQTALTLGWKASGDNVGVTGYDVYRNNSKVATVTTTTTAQTGLACGTAYAFGVVARDAAGNSSAKGQLTASTSACSASPEPPPPASSGDTTPPTQPTGLAPSNVTQTGLTLSWNASSDNVGVTGYDVYRNSTKVATVGATNAALTGLSCGTSYAFGVTARDAAGNASQQAQVTVPTGSCPTQPSDLTAPSQPGGLGIVGSTASSISLAWSASTDNVGVTGYRVYVDGTLKSTVTQTGTTVSSLTCGTTYTLEVAAVDAAGNASSRASVTGSTPACPDTQAPTAPTNVVATSRTATSIALSWGASDDNVGVVGYGTYQGGSQVGSTAGTTAIFSGLTCNTNYTLAVDASDAAGNRSAKATVMVATTACPDATPPSIPTGLATSNVTQTGLTLTWNASTDNVGVTGYDVSRNGTTVATTATTTSTQSGLTCGTSYTLGVVARDAAGNSSQRAQLNVTTASCSPAPTAPTGGWGGDFSNGGQDFGEFDMHDANLTTFTDPFVGTTKDVTIVPKPAGSIYPYSNYMARIIANNTLSSNSSSGQTVNVWQPGSYGSPWTRGNTVWCRVILVIPNGTDPRYPGKLTPVPGDGVNNSWHVLTEWHKNDGAGAPGPTSSKLETAVYNGTPALMFKPIGGLYGQVKGKYLYETNQVQTEANGAGGTTGPIGGSIVPLKFNHEYDMLFKWTLDPDPSVGRVEWYVDGNLRASVKIGTMFQKSDGSVPGLSFQAGIYRNYPTWAGNVTSTTSANEHVYVEALLTGPTRASVGG
jgi:chitodextrinase